MSIFKKLFSKESSITENEHDVESNSSLPSFKYYLDPLKTKAFIKSKKSCIVCGKKTGYIYNNAFYAVEDIENICPWCISNGNAAKQYDGIFHDMEVEDENISKDKVAELMERTPGYECMQPGEWPCHCDDICAFVDHVGWKDIVRLGLENELEEDINKILEYVGSVKEDIGNLNRNESSLCGYLFKCVHCGKHRLIVDLD